MRRYTHYLSQVFNHCEAMGQVVEINQRAPRPMAAAPDEKQSYQRHVAYQRQFDNERVAYGLQPNKEKESEIVDQAAQTGEDPLNEDNALESIFSAQIAGLAGILQRILEEKKAKESSRRIPETKPNKQLAQVRAPQALVTGPSKGRTLSPMPPQVEAPVSVDSAHKESGLMQSQWSIVPSSAPASGILNGHHNSDDLVRFSPHTERSGFAGSQHSLPETTTRKVTPNVAAQGSSCDGVNDAPVDGVNGLGPGNAANSASQSSTPFHWW